MKPASSAAVPYQIATCHHRAAVAVIPTTCWTKVPFLGICNKEEVCCRTLAGGLIT